MQNYSVDETQICSKSQKAWAKIMAPALVQQVTSRFKCVTDRAGSHGIFWSFRKTNEVTSANISALSLVAVSCLRFIFRIQSTYYPI